MRTDISLRGVSVTLSGRQILSDINVDLHAKTVAVIGVNGSGKSTFGRILAGLLAPTAGKISVHGLDVVKSRREATRQSGFMFPNPDAQAVMPTVLEDVSFSLKATHKPGERDRVALQHLKYFGLGELRDRSVHELSSGQKQLLALCAITVRKPALVIADEPTALLDGRNTEVVANYLLNRLEQQTVLITHNLDLAARCEVCVWFADGQIQATGAPQEIIATYRETFTC